ncbi:MAG TPA: 2Fe-2S iron-sulfur cluster-binding protein [Solimonas sp.]|nr:2Fe-2S iron-sulfur cluster-binding protein [Solimonas sp.]
MPKILFIDHAGVERLVEVETGKSLMQCAQDNLVPGIVGDCGGSCTCATCHAYIDPAWLDKLSPRSEEEEMMLDGALEVLPNSRLTCQITMTAELDGLVLRTPASQF